MKLLFLIWMPIQLSTEKHWLTFCHSAGANCVISFMTFLILQRWPVFPSATAASFNLAEVSSSSVLLTFASSRLAFYCFFCSMNLSHVLSNLRLLVGEETLLALLNVYSFRYSILRPFVPDVETFFVQEISNLHVTAVLTFFDASLLYALRCSYRKIMFKTGLLWPSSESIQRENKDLLPDTAQTMLRWRLFS